MVKCIREILRVDGMLTRSLIGFHRVRRCSSLGLFVKTSCPDSVTRIVSSHPADVTPSLLVLGSSEKSSTYAAMYAACAGVELDWASHFPKGTDLSIAGVNLRRTLGARMKQAGAKTCTFGHLVSRPGINLPDGTMTLTLQARGNVV